MQVTKKLFNVKSWFLTFMILILILLLYCYYYRYTYYNIGIQLIDDVSIKYGTKNVDTKKFIKNFDGKIENITKSIDSKKIGQQKVYVELKKSNITRKFMFYVDVVDKEAPKIEIKEDAVNITEGDEYNILDNISSVSDNVDGVINKCNEEVKDGLCYNVNTDFNNNVPGEYGIEIIASDKSGNENKASFKINVAEKPVVLYREEPVFAPAVQNDAGMNSKGNSIVSVASSLLGSPYVYGGTSPQGFDCSGFVQYVYAQNGISVSRSSSTQLYDGVGVSYEQAQPGDILIWGYPNGTVTHTAIFTASDTMIHAANPSVGVIQSSISAWTRGSDVQVLAVRRIVN